METIVKKFNGATFANVQTTINKIKQYVKENGYQFKDGANLSEITETKFNEALSDFKHMSFRKRKKLVNAMAAIEKHATLENINKFLHFLFKTVLKSESRVRVIKSDKEIAIEAKRKAYKDALERKNMITKLNNINGGLAEIEQV